MPGKLRRKLQPHYTACAAVLLDARQRAGLTQRQLAERLGIAKNAVDRAETGERRVDLAEAFIWAAALDITPEVIIKRIRQRLG